MIRSLALAFGLFAAVAGFSPEANARHSYGGGHHTSSHGGHYAGGHGSSHRGGHYRIHGHGGYGTHRR
jgi:hypothetical protein